MVEILIVCDTHNFCHKYFGQLTCMDILLDEITKFIFSCVAILIFPIFQVSSNLCTVSNKHEFQE